MQDLRIVILVIGLIGFVGAVVLPTLRVRGKSSTNGSPILSQTRRVSRFAARLVIAGWLGTVLWVLKNIFFPAGNADSLGNFVEGWFGVILGGLGTLLSVGILFVAQQNLGDSWRIGVDSNEKTDLVTDGLYKHTRNPFFLGMILLVISFALLIPSGLSVFLIFLVWVGLEIQSRLEEDHLERLHGAAFESFEQDVPKYIPWKAIMAMFGKKPEPPTTDASKDEPSKDDTGKKETSDEPS